MVLRFYLRFGGEKEIVLYTSIYIHTPPSLPSLGAQLFVPVSISLEHHPSAQHSEKYPRKVEFVESWAVYTRCHSSMSRR